jgi:hypothetical protein
MSHFIRCDRCDRQDSVIGTVSLPPGWQKVLAVDLCEQCCHIVRDFIRFKPSDAEGLPVEPIEEPAASIAPVGDKLFETAPEPTISADSHQSEETCSQGEVSTSSNATAGEPAGKTQPASAECSTEERTRTRKTRKIGLKPKLQGQDAILPDARPKPTAEPAS